MALTLFRDKTVTAIQIKKDRLHSWLLWWRPNGAHSCYPINQKNITPMPNDNPDPFKAYAAYRRAMNRVYAGQVEAFQGEYDSASKKLRVKALKRMVII